VVEGEGAMTPEEIKARALAWERLAQPRDLWAGVFLLAFSIGCLLLFTMQDGAGIEMKTLFWMLAVFAGWSGWKFAQHERVYREARGFKPGVWRSVLFAVALGSALTLFFALIMPVVFIAVHILALIGVPFAISVCLYSFFQ
jgi:hypothetical protein